ncbi:hypothetical protein GCM10011487_37980 [Steroidobacter agaridevorans]|uniref:DUF3618 domain-containing protein n=1 Tax=Steroidobacter agaridevorans TaxID=2695856 RepID=A0A829YG47_9GAMM|nr:DUF3618 domain-containing protein [Steroidobacter agaridevorans]GFE81798.1 hypothetical protein GCM10011487_37980 [Steroidobacter agaridevorans]GFE90543.1 hypothetical protein GCM10011488_54970 [Steroidobacter agaridevorans]
MNGRTDKRSAADLERRGEQIRANLDQTLDEIQRKFSSGELLDRSVEFIRDSGSELLQEAADTVRRNPVPVVLTAAGLVWLVASVARSRSGDEGYVSRDREWLRDEERWDRSARGRVRSAAHQVRSRARRVQGQVSDRLSDSMQTVQVRSREVRSRLDDLVQEQPLALGALALAAGALLGAALPMTEYENRWVGPVHDRTVARAKEAGRREYDNLREAVASSLERRGGNGARRFGSDDVSGTDDGSQRPVQG